MSAFDPCRIPLAGRQLLEASAGTGKTHALAELHLRLLAERADLAITGILVLTFTNAAAAELRDRLRARLLAAQSCLNTGQRALDPILARVRADDRDLRGRLARALSDFDAAPIGTIHSFCLRVLQEHPVECGVPTAVRVLSPSADLENNLVREVARDALEKAAGDGKLTLAWACHYLDAAVLARIVGEAVGRAHRIVPDPAPADEGAVEEFFADRLAHARALWERFRDELADRLRAAPLHRGRYGPAQLSRLLESVERWLQTPLPPTPPDTPLPIAALTSAALRAATHKGHADEVPSHPLLDALDELHAAALELDRVAHTRALAIRAQVARLTPTVRRRRLDRLDALDYDELTFRLLDALRGASGERLAHRLAREYPAALVDEAQDTDPAQHEILEALHAHGTALFLIGDPKQSIYAFRGADVFAYARAAARASRHSLDRNWRATPPLVAAVQAAFARPNAFGWSFITLPDVRPADGATTLRLELGDSAPPPFRIWLIPPPEAGGRRPLPAGRARRHIADALAAEIAALLAPHSPARLVGPDGPRAVEPADVAVLVTRHLEAAEVLAALSRAGVPAVASSNSSVFASDDAIYLRIVLDALARPRREDLARGAALTPILAVDPAALADPASAAWTAFMNRWVAAAELWPRRGVRETLERLFATEAVFERLLARTDGERRATNLRHLTDLLGAAESQRRMGPGALLAWFDAQIAASESSAEETELQLDSDARRVRVATIHHSKGLQYPIVYCPFLWALPHGQRNLADLAVCHDDHTGERILDVGGPDLEAHAERERLERFFESVRLTYVAVTRARAACTVVWGPFRGAAASPLAWLWHAAPDHPPGEEVDTVQRWDDRRIAADLEQLAAAAPGSIVVGPPPVTTPSLPPPPAQPLPPPGPARQIRRPLDDGWRIVSFTSLRAIAGTDADEQPDVDAAVAPLPVDETAQPRFRFPAGPAAGTVLHALLERVDFANPARDRLLADAAAALSLHGLDAAWAETATDLVIAALTTPLDDRGLRLCDLDPRRCVRELPFLMRLGRVTAAALNERLGRTARSDAHRPPPLVFEPVRGFLRGFVDLVFEADGRWYVLDYKSNLLGHAVDDYRPDRLAAEMAAADYELQALIYAVALRRLALARGISEETFADRWGGCIYLFLRGLSPETGPSRGVVRWRPDPAELAELSDLLDRGDTP
ncbi:MAG: exodeoxyribonuclease V subunit beta [Kiritimatiellae bacterium]|nr:exodeoxyribonuclease V subunit beta [Kiritimatiellia bacterium]